MMDFILKLMNVQAFAEKTGSIAPGSKRKKSGVKRKRKVFKNDELCMNFALKMMDYALQMMYFVLKMMKGRRELAWSWTETGDDSISAVL